MIIGEVGITTVADRMFYDYRVATFIVFASVNDGSGRRGIDRSALGDAYIKTVVAVGLISVVLIPPIGGVGHAANSAFTVSRQPPSL